MKKLVIVWVGLIFAVLSMVLFPQHSADAKLPIPLPTITVTIPGPVKTILSPLPGKTKVIVKPGPTKTVERPGPTKTVTKTVPGPTVTITQTQTQRVVATFTPKPQINVKTEKQIRHDIQVKERVKQITIGLVAFAVGILISIISLVMLYYVAYKKGEEDNVGFLNSIKNDLRSIKSRH